MPAEAINYGTHAPDESIDYGSHTPDISTAAKPVPKRQDTTGALHSFVSNLYDRLNPHLIDATMEAIKQAQEGGIPDVVKQAVLNTATGGLSDAVKRTSDLITGPGKEALDHWKGVFNPDVTPQDRVLSLARAVGGPVVSRAIDHAQKNDPAGAFGSITGDAANAALLVALPEAADAAPGVVSAVKDAATKPGTLKLVTGAGQGASAVPMLLKGHPFIAGGLAMRALDNIKEALKLRSAAGEVPALYEQIAKGMGGTGYADLEPAMQARVQQIAENLRAGKSTTPIENEPYPIPERTGPIVPPGSGSVPGGKTIGEMIGEELAARRGQAPIQPVNVPPAPESASLRTPLKPPVGQVPLVKQPIVSETPEIPPFGGVNVPLRPPLAKPGSVTPITDVPRSTTSNVVPEVSAAGNPVPEAFRTENTGETTGLQIPQEANARAAIVDKLAQHFHDAGVTAADLDAVAKNPEAHKLFWDNASQLPGLSKQAHYSASDATIQGTREALARLEGAGSPAKAPVEPTPEPLPEALRPKPGDSVAISAKKAKAATIAQQLAEELMKSEETTAGDMMVKSRKGKR